MKEKQILVIVKHPGEEPYVEPLFDNTLEAFQQAVGGYIETVTFATYETVVCNEEGRLMGLPHNCTVMGVDFCGTILVAGVKGDEFASLKGSSVPMLLRSLGMNTGKAVDQ